MAIALFLGIAVAVIVTLVVAKLLRGTDRTSAIGGATTCSTCGRKKGFLRCPHCNQNRENLPRGGI
jgi:hypothetical protein